MTKIKCSKCGKEDEVPFKPREGTPVFCKECYFKEKGITPRTGSFEGKKKEKPKEESEGDEFAEESEESEESEASEEDSENF
jgi:CxxC-x17-CxxC domain-containing protein